MRPNFPVLLKTGQNYRRLFPSEYGNADEIQLQLSTCRQQGGYAYCTCQEDKELPLVIRRRAEDSFFYLSKWPASAEDHLETCRWHKSHAARSSESQIIPGIEIRDDGLIRVRLETPMSRRELTKAPDPEKEKSDTIPPAQKAMAPLLALLWLLWEEAELNVWHPAMNRAGNLHILEVAMDRITDRIQVARRKLKEQLVYVTGGWPKTRFRTLDNNKTVSAAAIDAKDERQVLIAGFLHHWPKPGPMATRIGLTSGSAFAGYSFFCANDLFLKKVKSFPTSERALNDERMVAVLLQGIPRPTKDKTGYTFNISDFAFMPVTADFIPFDSSNEAKLAEHLVTQGRNFEKPLRFLSQDKTLPDFELLDCRQRPFPMEVWAMDTAEYLQHRAQKEEFNDQAHGIDGWWSWDVLQDDGFPALPQKI